MSAGAARSVLLLFPPAAAKFRHVELGMPQLAGFLRQAGFEVVQRDLNAGLVRRQLGSAEQLAALFAQRSTLRRTLAFLNEQRRLDPLLATATDPTPPVLAALERCFEDDPSFRVWVFDELSERLGLEPPSPETPAVLEWVSQGHRYYEQFYGDALADLREGAFETAGLSVLSFEQLGPALLLADFLKRRLGVRRVLLGGPWCSAAVPLAAGLDPLFDHVDGIIPFEAERVLADVLKAIDRGQELAACAGVLSRGHASLVLGQLPAPVPLGDLPLPAFQDLGLDLYQSRCLPVRTRRSCPWGHCSFCHHVFHLQPARARGDALAASAAVRVIEQLQRGTGADRFVLANHATPAAELRALAQELLARKVTARWSSLVRFEPGFDRATLQLLRDAGCSELEFGLETICGDELERVHKGIDPKLVDAVLEAGAPTGIGMNVFVLSYPSQPAAALEETFAYCRKRADWLQHLTVQRFALGRNSAAFYRPASLGIAVDDSRTDWLDVYDVPYDAPDELDFAAFVRMARPAILRFLRARGRSPETPWDVRNVLGDLPGATGWRAPSTSIATPGVRVLWIGATPAEGGGAVEHAATSLQRLGPPHQVDVLDRGRIDAPAALPEQLARHDYDLVICWAELADADACRAILRASKLVHPRAPTAVAGPLATSLRPEEMGGAFVDAAVVEWTRPALTALLELAHPKEGVHTQAGLLLA